MTEIEKIVNELMRRAGIWEDMALDAEKKVIPARPHICRQHATLYFALAEALESGNTTVYNEKHVSAAKQWVLGI